MKVDMAATLQDVLFLAATLGYMEVLQLLIPRNAADAGVKGRYETIMSDGNLAAESGETSSSG
jgi:hypothetical protein